VDEDHTVSVKSVILKDFQITKNKGDRVTNKLVATWFKSKKELGISKKKLVIELLSFGIKTYRDNQNRGYEGINYIGPELNVEEDEC
jgi:hypothetical protein